MTAHNNFVSFSQTIFIGRLKSHRVRQALDGNPPSDMNSANDERTKNTI
jgi:hypothetical protein